MVDVDEGDDERDERVAAVVFGIRKHHKVVFEELHLYMGISYIVSPIDG